MILNPLRLCILSLLSTLVFAQGQFLQPDSNVPDGTQSFKTGNNLEIKWKAGWWGLGTKQTYADLFLTDFKSESFVKLIRRNVSLSVDGSYTWKVDVSDSDAKSYAEFVLRFVKAINPPAFSDGAQAGMAPSRGFYLTLPDVSSSFKASTTAAKTSTSASTAIPTPSASFSSQPNRETKKSTPIGAIVGGVLGGLALIALGIISFLLLKLVKRRKAKAAYQETPTAEEGMTGTHGRNTTSAYYPEPPKYPQPPVPRYEDAPVAHELHDNDIRHEADTGSPRGYGR